MMGAYHSPDSSRERKSARGEVSMDVRVYIPTPYRRLTKNQAFVEGRGDNVVELLDDLETRFPGIRGHVFGEVGGSHRHGDVYGNNVAGSGGGGGRGGVLDRQGPFMWRVPESVASGLSTAMS